ncbi:hypothetical protein AOLI_G00166200 [Acnodon oligacanthus]
MSSAHLIKADGATQSGHTVLDPADVTEMGTPPKKEFIRHIVHCCRVLLDPNPVVSKWKAGKSLDRLPVGSQGRHTEVHREEETYTDTRRNHANSTQQGQYFAKTRFKQTGIYTEQNRW